MCRKFERPTPEDIAHVVRLLNDDAPAPAGTAGPDGETAVPGTLACVIANAHGSCEIAELTWGYAVPWQSDLIYNTRLESMLAGSEMWRESFERRRCIVPARAFFEGRGKRASTRFIAPSSSHLLLLAEVYEDNRFSIVTTEPNSAVARVHNRMPLVLTPARRAHGLTPPRPFTILRTWQTPRAKASSPTTSLAFSEQSQPARSADRHRRASWTPANDGARPTCRYRPQYASDMSPRRRQQLQPEDADLESPTPRPFRQTACNSSGCTCRRVRAARRACPLPPRAPRQPPR